MRLKSEVKWHCIKGFAVPLTFEKRIVKYENDTIHICFSRYQENGRQMLAGVFW